MNEEKEIWPSETGILDLPENWETLKISVLKSVRGAWKRERARLESGNQLQKFTDRMNREWAIETGIIENLYELDRGVTKTLIEHGFQAALIERGQTNKNREWVVQVLQDQQDALEGLFSFVKTERPLSTSYIKELHAVMLRNQLTTDAKAPSGEYTKIPLIRGDWKKLPNYPTSGGVTYRYCPPEQVASEMDRLIAMHLEHVESGIPPEIEAAWLHHRFSQIHPFQDGNGRVARTLASLIFIQNELFPVVMTRDDKAEYLDALEEADARNLGNLVDLFAKLQQVGLRIALSTSETTKKSSVTQALAALKETVSQRLESSKTQYDHAFSIAEVLKNRIHSRLVEITPQLETLLQKLHVGGLAKVEVGETSTEYPFQANIHIISQTHLRYFVNLKPYSTWVRLNMKWSRSASLVFNFHASGYEFSGALVCAPFLEIDDHIVFRTPKTLINVASEPFEFYYDEVEEDVVERFTVWSETVLTVALAELQKRL